LKKREKIPVVISFELSKRDAKCMDENSTKTGVSKREFIRNKLL
jgi:hypothetical protein